MKNAPPLQRDEVRRNYQGLYVEWETHYVRATRNENDLVRVMLRAGKLEERSLFVLCVVSFGDYQELAILKSETLVRVCGTITDVDLYRAELREVKLSFKVV